jgi:hypothetical protein
VSGISTQLVIIPMYITSDQPSPVKTYTHGHETGSQSIELCL